MQRDWQIRATVEAVIECAGTGVTPTRELVARGISRSRLDRAVARGELVSLRRGSVLPASTWAAADATERHRLAVHAALIAHPTAVASHPSAARLLDLPLLGLPLLGLPLLGLPLPGLPLPGLSVAGAGTSPGAALVGRDRAGRGGAGRGGAGRGGAGRGDVGSDDGTTERTSGRARSAPAQFRIPTVHVTIPGRRRTDAWLHIHGSFLPASHWTMVGAVPVTGYSRTFADTAFMLDPGAALALADAAVRRVVRMVEPVEDLRRLTLNDKCRAAACRAVSAVIDACANRPGIDAARRALALVDPASESVLESISRWQMHRHRIPMPQCGLPITGDDGRTYWADFVWWDLRIIGEADGALKYATRDDLIREKERQEALERAGWIVIRWNWAEAFTDPSIMIGRIQRAIARRRLHPPHS